MGAQQDKWLPYGAYFMLKSLGLFQAMTHVTDGHQVCGTPGPIPGAQTDSTPFLGVGEASDAE